jgi:hypothetical protein
MPKLALHHSSSSTSQPFFTLCCLSLRFWRTPIITHATPAKKHSRNASVARKEIERNVPACKDSAACASGRGTNMPSRINRTPSDTRTDFFGLCAGDPVAIGGMSFMSASSQARELKRDISDRLANRMNRLGRKAMRFLVFWSKISAFLSTN